MTRRVAFLILLLTVSITACASPGATRELTRVDVDTRVNEYYQRGLRHLERGELHPALDSFQMARAYDTHGQNESIQDVIEQTEARLKTAVAGMPRAARRGERPKPAEVEAVFKTYHSPLYPYSVDIPEDWISEPGTAKVGEVAADLLREPRNENSRASLVMVAHRLPDDMDRRAYVEANIRLLRSQGQRADEIGKRPVDSFETNLLRVRLNNEQGKMVNTIRFSVPRAGDTGTLRGRWGDEAMPLLGPQASRLPRARRPKRDTGHAGTPCES